jgi:hypothetical protein
MWAEYYLENYGWIPVDATWKQFDALDDKHFSSQQSTPELTPYANYVFNSADGLEVTDEQTVQLKSAPTSVFSEGSIVENLKDTVQTVREAKYALFLGRILGVSLIFPSEMEEAEQTLIESQVQLQSIVDSWKGQSQITLLDLTKALEDARSASQSAWLLITETFALFIGVSTSAMLAILIYLRRYRVKREVNA